VLLGIGMALSLYEAAFATITRQMPAYARRAISTITLVAGFARTVFWPLTAHLYEIIGWRPTYAAYAAIQVAVCFPLQIFLGAKMAQRRSNPRRAGTPAAPWRKHPGCRHFGRGLSHLRPTPLSSRRCPYT